VGRKTPLAQLNSPGAFRHTATGFRQCFDAVVCVIRPEKFVSEITYKVSNWTLSLFSLTRDIASFTPDIRNNLQAERLLPDGVEICFDRLRFLLGLAGVRRDQLQLDVRIS